MSTDRLLTTGGNLFLSLSKIIIRILIILNIVKYGFLFFGTILTKDPIKFIDEENIVYHIELDEKVKIDDTVIIFTDVIYEKDGNLNVFYKSFDTRLWGMGWGSSYIGEFEDDLGNNHFSGSGYGGSGSITKGYRTLNNFDRDAKMLTIEYDVYNRYYKVEIPLIKGGAYE